MTTSTPKRPIPTDTMLARTNESGPAHLLVDEGLHVSMASGEGLSLSMRLTPREALAFAERLAGFALASLETDGLSSAETAGSA